MTHDEFRSLVNIHEEDECWPWLGKFSSSGQPAFGRQSVRKILLKVTGDKHTVKATCNSSTCVNPKHLEKISIYKSHSKEYEDRRDNNRRVSRAAVLRRWKEDNPCPCGVTEWYLIDCHHRDPKIKEHHVGQCKTVTAVLRELAKCDPLCANCHRRHHHFERVAGGKDED